jgi:hypothetical protein
MDNDLTRRTFLGCTAATIGALAAAPQLEDLVKNRPPLAASAFYRLPLTSVKPAGWLKDQLRIQAEGITGHLGEFWPDVGSNSAWLGGSGEGWERGPYYLDGLLPLAYLLDDPKLIAKVKPWVDWTLDRQRPDGSIGPEKNKDWWPIMIMLKVLTQFQEATGDARVIPVMEKYFAYQSRMLPTEPLKSWAIYRWQDELASLLWLYNRTGDAKLLDLAHQLKAQGFDWRKFYEHFPFTGRIAPGQDKHESHGVNHAMALKTAALWYLVSHDPADRSGTELMLAMLDKFESLPNGIFSADEHFAGRNPSQGIELCAVVEAMFSRRPTPGRPAGEDRLQSPARRSDRGSMESPVRPAAESGLGITRPPRLDYQRPRIEPVRPRAELRLLHRQPSSRLAEIHGVSMDGFRRRWFGRRRLRPL